MARRAANRIRRLVDDAGQCFDDEQSIREQIFQFFRSRWSEQTGLGLPLLPVPASSRVSDADNETLIREVSADEIREALWALGPDKAPGPDGFPPFFFRQYWDIVGQDVISAVQFVFSVGPLPRDWQRTFITLVPKRPDASLPRHFRPISLCTTIYKICARLLVGRMQHLIPRLVSPEQGAFIHGRSISDNALIAQEFMHDLQRASRRHCLMAVKLDMERAYDCLSWDFLRHTLQEFGFHGTFIEWILACVSGPSFSILINGSPTAFFDSTMGLRQGCPLSPFLFILCADDLSRALTQAVCQSQLQPYMPGVHGPSLSHLLYADDCILLGAASLQNASVFNRILQSYCRASGQRVNLQKSVLCFSPATPLPRREAIARRFGIAASSDHLSYLGIPMTGRRPRQRDFVAFERRICDRLDGWQVTGLSMMGRVTLLRSILSSLPLYLMSTTLIPTSCLRRIERRFQDFLWASMQGNHGVHLLSWDLVCLPLRHGGLGIQSLIARREALLARHASRFLLDPHCLWSSIMRSRYGTWSPSADSLVPRGCSFLWRAICGHARLVMADTQWMIGDGRSVVVMDDAWISDLPLSLWPTFLGVDLSPTMTVRELICPDRPAWHVPSVLRLFGEELAFRILAIPLVSIDSPDTRLWRRSCLPRAPTSDLILHFSSRDAALDDASWIWRLPLHPRTLLFLWKVSWDRLPTCSLLAGRGFSISATCPRCGLSEETTEHAILSCPVAATVWQRRLYPPGRDGGTPSRSRFLLDIREAFRHGSFRYGSILAHTAFLIWLTRNQYIFSEEVTSAETISHRASSLAAEYHHFVSSVHADRSGHWGSPAASAALRPTVFISWDPPPPGFAKVNFDGSVTGRSAGSGFVIRGPDGDLLAAGGFGSLDSSVPMAELQAAWAGIIYAVRRLGLRSLILEGDSLTVIRWLRREKAGSNSPSPLILDVWSALDLTDQSLIRHIFREANSAADWVASFAAHHQGPWCWRPGDHCPSSLLQILYSDMSGLTRAR